MTDKYNALIQIPSPASHPVFQITNGRHGNALSTVNLSLKHGLLVRNKKLYYSRTYKDDANHVDEYETIIKFD